MKIDYTNLSFTQLIDKIETNRFFDLPRMAREAFRRLLTRVEALEDAPVPTGNFIPLTGTEVGSPVSGNIEIIDGVSIIPEPLGGAYYLGDIFKTALGITVDGITVVSNSPLLSRGLTGEGDFTPNITDLDYTQKKYVDERGSVFNATTSVLSASDLNTAYPNAKDGFSVIAPNVVGGGKYYIKAGAGWVYQQILAVV